MILDDVKLALRVSGTDLDTEITDLIDSAKADLSLSGVLKVDETDSLIKRAITVYCKANFGYDNPDAERFQNSYDLLKAHMASSMDYNSYTVTFSVTDNNVAVDEAVVTFNNVIKKTGTAGTALFYISGGFNYSYTVAKDGYVTQEANIDISAATTVNIALVVVV